MWRKVFFLILILILIGVDVAHSEKVFVAKAAKRYVHMTGFTRPRTVITISSEENARCIAVYADVGDAIKPDGLFARLDPTFIDLDIRRNLDKQQAIDSDVTFYSKEAERYRTLIEKKHAAQTTLDALVRDLQTAREDSDALKVEELILREHKNRHSILAPAGWKVIERYIEPGELVRNGDELAKIGNFNVLIVPMALTPSELITLQKMEKIELELPELNKKVAARIENVSPDFDPAMRKIQVDLAIDKFPIEKRGGIRANLYLPMEETKGAVIVPDSALVRGYEEAFLIRDTGEEVPVIVMGDGDRHGTKRVRSKEISAGDRFLSDPPQTVF
ncbi:efflux RND transporter periplasmic adaptor subunit [Halodesulfovibrio marinisediminis]|uniref:Multidrug efflux pump subunit AcrA (Membrane-fusion protein) n=1 Tax=Halodesulfovibrio marinisediminis DSM 17456 TaxID=1121457 RepID=A0A1N6DK83_9BACT|nr:HlyD family efflux transporter periplasmic adaptor subunit [Halodesulfovibrio marinisediminis]SIN71146.1 Multidrug efflux pump subunit AcrA (membrane-fusion protein) [Halodesulfovibrio marinisediminis DSM 17456]